MHIFEPLGAHRMAREASPDTNDNLVPAAFQKEHLAQRWQQARAIGTPLSIVHLRLRQLKEIELAFGHSIAAEVLRQVAGRIAPWVAHEGGLAHVAEDILSLVLYARDAADAKLYAEALCHMLDTAIDIDDMSVVVTIQAGVACNSGETASPDTMVRQANAALFHSTLSGASVTVFAIAAHRAYVARLTLMGDLRAPLNVTNCACIASPRLT